MQQKNTSLIAKSNNALIVKATVIRRMYARKNQNAGSALRSMKQSSAKAKQYNVQTVMAHTRRGTVNAPGTIKKPNEWRP